MNKAVLSHIKFYFEDDDYKAVDLKWRNDKFYLSTN